jgi:hypothetical protein
MHDLSKNIFRFVFPSVLDTIFIVILIFILFIDAGAHILRDADTGFHIMTGYFILDNLQFPSRDIFSYSCAGQEWVAFSWGTGVVFALLDTVSGLNGVVIFSALLILATIFITYRLLISWKINFFVLILSVITVTSLMSIHWLARPHLFTIFFTALTFYILEMARNNKKLYWLIPLIILFWVNFHPGFISGFFLLGAYGLGNILEYLIASKDQKQVLLERIKSLIIIGFVSLAMTLFNPYGFKLYPYIYDTLTSFWIVNATSEYLTPNFHGTLAVIVYELVIAGLILFGFLKNKKVLDLPKLIILIFWLHLSLFAIRNIALFGVIAVPCLALLMQNSFESLNDENLKQTSDRLLQTETQFKYHTWPVVIILIAIIASLNQGFLFGKNIINCQFSPLKIPVNAMAFYEQNPIEGNLLNQDNWGGYLIYKYPDVKVFMDGRLDMYQQDFLDEYQKVIFVKPGWQDIIEKYNIKWVLFANNTIFHNFLETNPNWQKVYEDSLASIFVLKPVPVHLEPSQ